MRSSWFILSVLIGVVIYSCRKDPEILDPVGSSASDLYKPVTPSGWPAPVYTFENNTVTEAGFTLGRYLFYETLLSEDTTVSCGSCHQQYFGFSNGPGHAVSHGVHALVGKRNSPAIFNVTWMQRMMWDGGAISPETQPIGPIQNPIEMNLSLINALNRIAASPKYKDLFKKAYGDTTVNSQRFLKAFAQFMGLMVSYQSKYDNVKNGKENFTTAENNGYNIYKNKCAGCHVEPLFSDYNMNYNLGYGFRNNGLPLTVAQDSGRWKITHDPNDIYKFKTPSLRNLGFTAPYMHDGRFGTLDAVLNHYTTGVVNTTNVDPLVAGGITLSGQEKSDLLSFLATLNDYKFVSDPRFKEIH
jgi:cytochrome c peroxidase